MQYVLYAPTSEWTNNEECRGNRLINQTQKIQAILEAAAKIHGINLDNSVCIKLANQLKNLWVYIQKWFEKNKIINYVFYENDHF